MTSDPPFDLGRISDELWLEISGYVLNFPDLLNLRKAQIPGWSRVILDRSLYRVIRIDEAEVKGQKVTKADLRAAIPYFSRETEKICVKRKTPGAKYKNGRGRILAAIRKRQESVITPAWLYSVKLNCPNLRSFELINCALDLQQSGLNLAALPKSLTHLELRNVVLVNLPSVRTVVNSFLKNIGKVLSSLPLYDVESVYVDSAALSRHAISEAQLVVPAIPLDDAAIQQLLVQCDHLVSC